MKTPPCLLLASLIALPAGAQVASLVADITPQDQYHENRAADPGPMAAAGGRLVFAAGDDATGYELWASDGTPIGTELLQDICPGECGSNLLLVGATKKLTFWTNDNLLALWRSDGTRAGTFQVADRLRGNSATSPWAVRGDVLFFARCESGGCLLWRTDGTTAGTRKVSDIQVRSLALAGDRVLALTDNDLWRIDPGGETPVRVVSTTSPAQPLGVVRNRLLMIVSGAAGQELWSTDGTAAGTRALTQFANPTPFPFSVNLFATAGRLYFVADDVTHGEELWASDGTPEGTKRLTDFGYYFPFRFPLAETLQEVGPRVVFAATDGLSDDALQLWSTDGRPESTTLLLTPCSPRDCFSTDQRGSYRTARAGSAVLFPAEDEAHGVELWTTDGTPAGTRLFREFCPGPCDSQLALMPSAAVTGGLYFATKDHLWRTDGTDAGTRQVTRRPLPYYDLFSPRIFLAGERTFLRLGSDDGGRLALLQAGGGVLDLTAGSGQGRGSELESLVADGDTLRFLLDGPAEYGLWQSAGTAATTRSVSRDIGTVDRPVAAGGVVYFFQWEDELWRFTDDGALKIADLSDGSDSVYGSAAALGSRLYFNAIRDGVWAIWRTDGTADGTAPFVAIPAGWRPGRVASSGGRLYFGLYDQEGGTRVWTSDGTAGGTREILSLTGYQVVGDRFVRAGDLDFFPTYGYDNITRLWRTDGTAAGTSEVHFDADPVRVADGMVAHQGSLYGLGEDYAYPFGNSVLWRVDGGTAVRLGTFGPHGTGGPFGIASVGGRVVFAVDDGEHGLELWATDGTPDGTRLLRDINPGPLPSDLSGFTVAGGRAFFSARDGVHGTELWQTDGTAGGTRLVHDVNPGPAPSAPQWLTVAGDRLYFTADDGLTGRELWALPLSGAAGCQPSERVLCLQGGRFRVEAVWRDFKLADGAGTAVPLTGGTGDTTGYFWFFSPSNAEVILKVLDGRGLNGHFWVFYGALSNVEYKLTVTDTQTGLTLRYLNPLGQLASVGDTTGFGPQGAFSVAPPSPPALVRRLIRPVSAACEPGPLRLCLNNGRFAVEAVWKDFAGKTGTGKAISLSADTGYFWFFDAANAEVVLKVLDGRAVNDHFWVFYGALSNVEYTLTVTDTQTGEVKVYSNPAGRFASVADTGAF